MTHFMYDPLSSGITVTSDDGGGDVPVDYDFDMVIGEYPLTGVENVGYKEIWGMGSCDGKFPETESHVNMLYCSSGTNAAGDPLYKFFFGSDSGTDKWLGADTITMTFTFEDSTELVSPTIPWTTNKYQRINEVVKEVFDALSTRIGETVSVHVEPVDMRMTKDL
ncbi:hypothetical protein [Vibrio harveyi]